MTEANKKVLTITPGHSTRYLNQDSCITEDHDDQRQQEEAHKGEHVVDGLFPMLDKAAMGGALGEVLWDCDGYIVKYKYLQRQGEFCSVMQLNQSDTENAFFSLS